MGGLIVWFRSLTGNDYRCKAHFQQALFDLCCKYQDMKYIYCLKSDDFAKCGHLDSIATSGEVAEEEEEEEEGEEEIFGSIPRGVDSSSM